jgi:hypothetical protein
MFLEGPLAIELGHHCLMSTPGTTVLCASSEMWDAFALDQNGVLTSRGRSWVFHILLLAPPHRQPSSRRDLGTGRGGGVTTGAGGSGETSWGSPASSRPHVSRAGRRSARRGPVQLCQLVQNAPDLRFMPGPIRHILPVPLGVAVSAQLQPRGKAKAGGHQEAGSPAFRVLADLGE